MVNHISLIMFVCVLLAFVGHGAAEVVVVEDNFPGFAEDPRWDYSWNVGIGTTTFDATSPGFAHLKLGGPWSGPPDAYQNAEIIMHSVPAYRDFEVRLRNSNNNGWDAPGAPGSPDPNHGLGSRGWGFWSGSALAVTHSVWFMSISPESSPAFWGRGVVIVRDGVPVLWKDLGIDLTQWHIYRIQWRPDYIGVFIDDMNSPAVELTDPNKIPNEPLTFTIWVDNYVLSGDLLGYTIGYLDVPAIDQSIDVDYVRIYVPDTADAVPILPYSALVAVVLLLLMAGVALLVGRSAS